MTTVIQSHLKIDNVADFQIYNGLRNRWNVGQRNNVSNEQFTRPQSFLFAQLRVRYNRQHNTQA